MYRLDSNARAVTHHLPSSENSVTPPDQAAQQNLSGRVTRSLVRVNRSANVDSGLGQGMEMALTLCVFLGLGWLVDQALGTGPLFMVILVVFAMIGQSARMWFTYDARMKMLEEERRRLSGSSNPAERG